MTDRNDGAYRLDSLIEQWLDDDLGPAESAELEAALIESPAARNRFWEKAAFDSLVHEAVGLTGPAEAGIEPARSGHGSRVKRIAAGLLVGVSLLAVGGGVGSLLTTQARAGLVRTLPPRVTVLEDGFESGPPPLAKYVPVDPGVWSGDATTVVGAKRGVIPLAGARMLELVGPHSIDIEEPAEFATEIWRVIPIDAVRAAATEADQTHRLTDGQLRIDLEAAFNQRGSPLPGPADPRTVRRAKVAGLGVYAFRGSTSDVRSLWNDRVAAALASGHVEHLLDEHPGDWQAAHVTLAVPVQADFLLVHCYIRDSQRRSGAVFDGQFMDDIRVSASFEPTAGGGGL